MSAEPVAALHGTRSVRHDPSTGQEYRLLVVEETPQASHRLSSLLRRAFPQSTVITCSSVGDVIRELTRESSVPPCVVTAAKGRSRQVVRTRGRGAGAGREGPADRRRGTSADHQRKHRVQPPQEYLPQAQGLLAGGSGTRGAATGPRIGSRASITRRRAALLRSCLSVSNT